MPKLSNELALLEARGLIRLTRDGSRTMVRFKHALTREATYNSILQARRAELHRAAAETLEKLYHKPDLDTVLTIADHWLNGGADERALVALTPYAQSLNFTGRSATLLFALQRIRRATLTGAQATELDFCLGDCYAARGEYETARELYLRALPGVESPARRSLLLRSIGTAFDHLGEYEQAIEYHAAALELAGQAGDVAQQAQASGGLGLAYANLGQLDRAETYLQASRTMSAQLGASLELANADYNLAVLLFNRGKYDEAIQAAGSAHALDLKFNHSLLAARSDQLLGVCFHALGDLAQAEMYYQRALAAARAGGDTLGTALTLGNLAELYADEDELNRAQEAYAETLRLLRGIKHDNLLAFNLAGLGQVLLRQANAASSAADKAERLAQGVQAADEAIALAERIRSPERQGVAYRVRAELALAQGDLTLAEREAEQAWRALEGTGAPAELDRTTAILAQIRTARQNAAVP